MNESDRTMRMSYSLTDASQFTVRFDPPYESMDGGCDEQLCSCTRSEIRETIANLILPNLDRLSVNQTPMIIEVRRMS
jgi:hypothetical protein